MRDGEKIQSYAHPARIARNFGSPYSQLRQRLPERWFRRRQYIRCAFFRRDIRTQANVALSRADRDFVLLYCRERSKGHLLCWTR